jgi:hypothetical protein
VTREERVFINADDLLELEIACRNEGCSARVAYSLSDSLKPNIVCPVCNKDWFEQQGDPYRQALIAFASILRQMREMHPTHRFDLRLRVHEKSIAE